MAVQIRLLPDLGKSLIPAPCWQAIRSHVRSSACMLSALSSPLALLLPVSRCPRVQMAASGPQADAQRWIEEQHGAITKSQGMGGSGWASFCRVSTAEREFFVKTSNKNCEQMFYGEAIGLRAMHATNTIRIPEVRVTVRVC